MRSVLAVALAAAFHLSAIGTARSEWTAYKSGRVDSLVEPFRMRGNEGAHSLSVALGVDGELVLARGYGEARPGLLATERTAYHIGSLTKQFTAAAILSLIERGATAPLSGAQLSLSSQAGDLFQGVAGWAGDDRPPVTVRSLLSMTSGLPVLIEHPPAAVDPWGPIAAARMLDAIKSLKPSGPPHEFVYSNSSYFLLAQLIEAAAGPLDGEAGSYRGYLRSAVFTKAGLKDTGFIDDYAAGTALAVATPSWSSATPYYRKRPAFVEPDWLKGAADMASSARDLFMWNKALMEDKVLCLASRALMFSDSARVGPSRYYGMGWFIEHGNGWDTFSHTGDVPGFTSLNMIAKALARRSWISVSLLTNGDGVEHLDELAADIVRVALQ